MKTDPEKELCESWSIGRLRPWLQMVAEREIDEPLRGRMDPSDVVQMTLMKAWQAESGFVGNTPGQRLAWLRMIMKNTIRDQQRRLLGTQKRSAGRESPATDLLDPTGPGLSELATADTSTVSSPIIAAEDALMLAETLAELPEVQRSVIQLRHFEDQSYAEIAQQLNKTESAVRMIWVRALRNLAAEAATEYKKAGSLCHLGPSEQ